MPKPVVPVVSQADRDRATLAYQSQFLAGFSALSDLAPRVVSMPRGRVTTPAETMNRIVNAACAAVADASSVSGMTETDEDFSPLEHRLAEIVLATMAASSTHRLRVAQCVAAKLASTVSL